MDARGIVTIPEHAGTDALANRRRELVEESSVAALELLQIEHFHAQGNEDEEVECSLCMVGLGEGDAVRKLPCGHVFHVECVDRWLMESQKHQKRRCPLCNTDPISAMQVVCPAGVSAGALLLGAPAEAGRAGKGASPSGKASRIGAARSVAKSGRPPFILPALEGRRPTCPAAHRCHDPAEAAERQLQRDGARRRPHGGCVPRPPASGAIAPLGGRCEQLVGQVGWRRAVRGGRIWRGSLFLLHLLPGPRLCRRVRRRQSARHPALILPRAIVTSCSRRAPLPCCPQHPQTGSSGRSLRLTTRRWSMRCCTVVMEFLVEPDRCDRRDPIRRLSSSPRPACATADPVSRDGARCGEVKLPRICGTD